MNKNLIGVLIAIVAIVGITGVVIANKSDSSPASSNSSQTDMSGMDMKSKESSSASSSEQDLTGQAEVTMDIKEFAFSKKSIKVSKGTKITWTNQDEAHHNVVAKEDGGPKGQLLAKGESYSFTFDTAGTFNYKCEPHPYMKGIVNVVE